MPDAIRYSIMGSNAAAAASATATPLRQIRKKAAERGHDGGRTRFPPLRQRTRSAPAVIESDGGGKRRRKRRLLVEDHYRVDPDDKKLLPGALASDDDWDRDLHDFFNLVSLVPVVVLNAMNWNWDVLLDPHGRSTVQESWTGEWFPLFYAVTVGYFTADLIWVVLVPQCVKSPGIIIQHHLATLLYLVLPYQFPELGWLMGACLSVEVNTWLLIARRVFNKQGFEPYVINVSLFSIRIKLISILFYVTWFVIRCYIYPCILMVVWTLWHAQWEETGVVFGSRYSVAIVLHSIFCLLNFKWTFDLFMSKWRALRSGNEAKVEKGL
mmetsp:Transcript_45196/g.96158  ORF Transcript_45196/g.96158 Transcript_45196/m.96158 type:complete len:325 (+) Transcript_45196:349-1323(+)